MDQAKIKIDRKSFLKMGAVFLAGLFCGRLPGDRHSPAPPVKPLKEARFYSKKNTLAG